MKYVILAAGRGKRLIPLTNKVPKPLLPIVDKSVIEWILHSLPEPEKIVIVVNYMKEKIIEQLKNTKLPIVFVEQKERLGTGDALLSARKEINGDFVVLNGDAFFDPSLFSLLGKEYCVIGKEVEDVSRFGEIIIEKGMLKGIREKEGKGRGIINTGTYYLPEKIFEYLEKLEMSKRGEKELTSAVVELSKEIGIKVKTFDGYWQDIGTFDSYLNANLHALELLRLENYISPSATVENSEINKSVILGGKIRNSKIFECVVLNGEIEGKNLRREVVFDVESL